VVFYGAIYCFGVVIFICALKNVSVYCFTECRLCVFEKAAQHTTTGTQTISVTVTGATDAIKLAFMTKYYKADIKTLVGIVIIMGMVMFWVGVSNNTSVQDILQAEGLIVLGFGTLGASAYFMQFVKISDDALHYVNYLYRYRIPIASITRMKRGSTVRNLPVGNAICIDYDTVNQNSSTPCMGITSYKKTTISDLVADLATKNSSIIVEDSLNNYLANK
jgi:hypothetical protein